jgi:hypothetical protein
MTRPYVFLAQTPRKMATRKCGLTWHAKNSTTKRHGKGHEPQKIPPPLLNPPKETATTTGMKFLRGKHRSGTQNQTEKSKATLQTKNQQTVTSVARWIVEDTLSRVRHTWGQG